MKNRLILFLKLLTHLACLLPLAWIIIRFLIGENYLASLAATLDAHNIAADFGPDPINAITHITGNWALRLLLCSLAITPIRRIIPQLGWLIRFRRLLGLYAFFYACLHLTTYIWLFSNFNFPAMWDDILKRRFIQVGLLAWLILLALALTSTLWAIRKLGGRRWQWLHRLAYLAAIAAIIHYWWLVKPGVTAPLTMTLVLAVLLLARLFWSLRQKFREQRP
jgi:sulfoxide reductase heme-binding subunit YedZ